MRLTRENAFRWGFNLGTRFYLALLVVIAYLILVGYGIVFVHSTSNSNLTYPNPDDMRHLIQVVFAVMCGILVCLPHWRIFEKWANWIYVFTLIGLVAVLFVGPSVNSTRRWLNLIVVRFQVSEAGKIALVLILARYLKATREKQSVKTSLWALMLTLFSVLLIVQEPDLGTGLLLPPVFFAMLMSAGGKYSHILIIVLIGLFVSPIVYEFGLAHYQKKRILGFISPEISAELDPDSVLQLNQSKEAIGTGGFLGKGLGKGNSNLPVRESDFVFAVVAEESGFLGAAVLVFIYMLFFFLCLEIAADTHDLFGRLVCVGLSVSIFIQMIINITMTIGLLPVTGINLPLISKGGSSLMATSISIGIIINIALRPIHTLARPSRLLRH